VSGCRARSGALPLSMPVLAVRGNLGVQNAKAWTCVAGVWRAGIASSVVILHHPKAWFCPSCSVEGAKIYMICLAVAIVGEKEKHASEVLRVRILG
jgi:hypothetical protein